MLSSNRYRSISLLERDVCVLMDKFDVAMVFSAMNVPGLPLCYVNPAFEELTGFSKADAIGQNCRFLQGKDTEQEAVAEMIYALQNAESCEVMVTNYRKDGTPFQNLVRLEPVHDSAGEYRYLSYLLLSYIIMFATLAL